METRKQYQVMIVIMMETITLISKGNPQFKIQTPTRVGETERGKYLVYETQS